MSEPKSHSDKAEERPAAFEPVNQFLDLVARLIARQHLQTHRETDKQADVSAMPKNTSLGES
jgi:hypothetical protein